MTYLFIIIIALSITACTLISVDVSSDDDGTTTVEPNGINVTVYEEKVSTGKGQ